jgi:hypothetical protein
MSKIKQQKIGVALTDENLLRIAEDQGVAEYQFNWKLVRESDGLTRQSKEVMWIEFDDNGFFKSKHEEPAIGRSLIMSPFNQFFTWQTTVITEILEEREGYIKFRTGNSLYELTKLA